MSTPEVRAFDPAAYKRTTREQWQATAEAWHRWGPTLEAWLGQATQTMLDMAGVTDGARVLDVAAGAGGQTIAAAQRVGPSGTVLAVDISPAILEYAQAEASDGRTVERDDPSHGRRGSRGRAWIVRCGDLAPRADVLPGPAKGTRGDAARLARPRTGRGHRLLGARTKSVQRDPDVDHQATRRATAAAASDSPGRSASGRRASSRPRSRPPAFMTSRPAWLMRRFG